MLIKHHGQTDDKYNYEIHCSSKIHSMIQCTQKGRCKQIIYVTGPAKIGHVGTSCTPPHNILYLNAEIGYFYSITFIVKPTILLRSAENVMAKQ